MTSLRARRWLSVLVLAVACSRPAAPPSEPAEPAGETSDAASEPEPAVEPTHPLELVPGRARVMLMARSPTRLAEAWERSRLAAEHPEAYEDLVGDMQRALGRDLLDPTQLVHVGIDPSAPVGIAVLSLRDEALMLFGACSDPARLAQTAVDHGATRRSVGTAELLVVDEDVTLVLRHGLFAVVMVGRHRPTRPDHANEVARVDPRRSLAHAPVLHRALAGLPDDADLHGMLDVAGLFFDELDAERRADEEGLAQTQRRLAETTQRGGNGSDRETLQRELADEQDFVARRRREREATQHLVTRTLGSIEGIGLVADADLRGLRGRVHVALAPDSVFRRLLVPREAAAPAVLALDHEPQLVLATQLHLDTAIELLSEVMRLGGGSYESIVEAARTLLRIELDREVRPQLDGQVALVLAADVPDHPASLAPIGEIVGGAWSLGVRDPFAAKAVLDGMVRAWPELPFREAPEVGGYLLPLPDAPQPLWVGVVADQLVIAPDPALLRRIADGVAGAAASRMPDPEAWARLTEGPALARLALHHRLPLMMVLALGEAFDSMEPLLDVEAELQREFTSDELAAVPRGKAVRALDRRLERAQQRESARRDQQRAERRARAWRLGAGLGITVGAVRPVDTGWMIEGGHYVAGGLGRYVETLWELVELERSSHHVDELERARHEVEHARWELLEARRRELQRALARGRG